MSRRIGNLQSLKGGIAKSKKNGGPNTFRFGRSIDFRSDSSEVTIAPLTSNISGSVVTDLPMWFDVAGDYLYAYGNTGNVYQINTSDTVTNEYTIPSSVGNGLGYLAEDKYLYMASNTSISRKSTANAASGTYYPNFLENEGGEPTNTRSILFVAASSMSATRADTASLSITGDITLETYVKPTSMPTGSNTMALMSKWDESGTKQSYKLAFVTTSNAFGDGSDGALTISSDTTEAPIDSACTGTSGSTSLSATNASFAAGQAVLIHQTQGTGAGTTMRNTIAGYTAGTITLADPLNATYTTGAQVRVLKQYTNVTVNSGVTYSAKAWNGTVGGILAFLYSGTLSGAGVIDASGKGFRGASAVSSITSAVQGEGTAGASGTTGTAANGNGGGGGSANAVSSAGGGGGANGANGTSAPPSGTSTPGVGGSSAGSADLTTAVFGGGGGGGGAGQAGGSGSGTGGTGGNGGGYIYIAGVTDSFTGEITAHGSAGGNGSGTGNASGGGGGGGGSIHFLCQTATLGSSVRAATGGAGGAKSTNGAHASATAGGAGSTGRIAIAYYTSYTGTTNPTINATQDDTLGATNGYALRFYVSSTGNNSETYTQNIADPTGQWNRFSVAWDASASTAYMYQNGVLIGTKTGALTAIHDNASIFGLATFVSSGSANTAFYDGLMDDARVWNDLRTATEINNYNTVVLTGSEGNLVAYYKMESGVTDSQTSGLNDLTANNSPTYSTDIPFTGITTRGDEDVSISGSGQTYTLTTALNEGATHRQTFTPTKEPLKSIALNIGTKGTGNWTIVVHDALNRELTSMTVSNTDLINGVYEFIFASSVRPVLDAPYHIHAYSTVADGTLVSGVASDMEGAYLKTYYQILVSDEYHPIKQFTNFIVIGNERYVAKLEAGNVYNPHRLTLPSGYRVRCFAFWRDYIAIGTWQGSDVADIDSSKVFFWDGTSDTYVEPLDVPQGAINALFGRQGKLLISAGYRGKFFEYAGGEEAIPAFIIPEASRGDKIEMAPGSICMWDGIVQVGGPFTTDSTTVHQGVYTWGRNDSDDPVSLGFDYPLSIGDQMSSLVKVASTMGRGKKLYIGYQNGGAYGIDIVSRSANPAATATVELSNIDMLSVADVKYPLTFRVDFLPLVSGQSVSIKYKPDRSTSWYTLQTQSTAGASEVAGSINQRVKEVQFAVDYVTNGSQLTTINYAFDMEQPTTQNMRYVK